jgi:hypothetical protein
MPAPVKAMAIRRRQRALAIRGWHDLAMRVGEVDGVAVVGNAGYLGELEQGGLIDRYDIVIRLNNFRTAGHEHSVGTRCDIFLTNFFTDIDFGRPELRAVPLIAGSVPNNLRKARDAGLFHRHGEHLADGMARLARHEVFVPSEEEFHHARALSGGAPSTGFMALRLALGHLRWRRIFLTGFSFFRGREHYFGDEAAPRPRHDFERERYVFAEALLPLIGEGRASVDAIMARHLAAGKP